MERFYYPQRPESAHGGDWKPRPLLIENMSLLSISSAPMSASTVPNVCTIRSPPNSPVPFIAYEEPQHLIARRLCCGFWRHGRKRVCQTPSQPMKCSVPECASEAPGSRPMSIPSTQRVQVRVKMPLDLNTDTIWEARLHRKRLSSSNTKAVGVQAVHI